MLRASKSTVVGSMSAKEASELVMLVGEVDVGYSWCWEELVGVVGRRGVPHPDLMVGS